MRKRSLAVLTSALRGRSASVVFLITAFVCALGWARARDPFTRIPFELRDGKGLRTAGMAVLPRPVSRRPVIIYLHGSNGDLLSDGTSLRPFAERGFAVVSLNYNKTNSLAFDRELGSLRDWLETQSWAETGSMAWIGASQGAQMSLGCLLRNPAFEPRLYVRIGGGLTTGLPMEPTQVEDNRAIRFNCPTVLVHGENDRIFPAADTGKLADLLRRHGAPVGISILKGQSHGFRPDRAAVMRSIAEYCGEVLQPGQRAFTNRTRSKWIYWVPVLMLSGVHLAMAARRFRMWTRRDELPELASHRLMRFGAWGLMGAAVLISSVHLVAPRLDATAANLRFAGRWIVWDQIQDDFDYLKNLDVWGNASVKDVVEHAELANYREPFLYDEIDPVRWREYVVSPAIDEASLREVDWRRPLWENFYPRIRKETNPMEAAEIVVRFLSGRVAFRSGRASVCGIRTAWEEQAADDESWERLYVAAMRSATIAARLGDSGRAELWTGVKWVRAPRPVIGRLNPVLRK